jgi:hypothetical protein
VCSSDLIRRYQQDAGLNPTGQPTFELLQHLLARLDRGAAVAAPRQ